MDFIESRCFAFCSVILMVTTSCTQLDQKNITTDNNTHNKLDVSKEHIEGQRPAITIWNGSNDRPAYVSLSGSIPKVSKAEPITKPTNQLISFINKNFTTYKLKNSSDYTTFKMISKTGAIEGAEQQKNRGFSHRLPIAVVKWDQKFLDIPIYEGKLAVTFTNGNISSVSGTVFSKQELEKQFGKIIREKHFLSQKKAEKIVREHVAIITGSKKKSISINSVLKIDVHNNRLAYIVFADSYRVFVDAKSGVIYKANFMNASWNTNESILIRAYDLPPNRAHFIKSLDNAIFRDGRADSRWPGELPYVCEYRTTYGSELFASPPVSTFPYPSTYRNDNSLPQTEYDWCTIGGLAGGLTSDNNYDLFVQNTHYRISTAARYVSGSWRMHLFADWAPEKKWPLHVYAHYHDGPGGGGYQPDGGKKVSKIELGISSKGNDFDASGWIGRFIPLHEYGHYIHHMYGYWWSDDTCDHKAVGEGLADALALSFAAMHDPTPPSDTTFLTPISGPNARPWWLTPSAEEYFRKVDTTCTSYYDFGLSVSQVLYKLLNNRVCTSFDATGCIPETILQFSPSCSQCHENSVDPLELSREIGRESLAYAMSTISSSDATMELLLHMMQDYIETHYSQVIQDHTDRNRVRLVFNQHNVNSCSFCHGN